MRALVILAIALATTPAIAEIERDRRLDDTGYVQVGTHLGAIIDVGHDAGGGATLGIHGAAGVRLTPDLAVQLSANNHVDAFGSGRSIGGVGVGLSWFVLDWTAVTANVRYRDLSDSEGFAETVGAGIGGALCLGFCEISWVEQDSRDIGVELALSSTVQWQTLTFGVEWVSFHQPLVLIDAERRLHHAESGRTETQPTDDLSATDLPWDLRILSLSVGAAF